MENPTIDVRIDGELSVQNHTYLFLLYEPLIGAAAVKLYELLLAIAQTGKPTDKQMLMELSGFDEAQYQQAHVELEKYMLLDHLYNPEDGNRVFKIFPCKSIQEFLSDDIFARITIHELSAQRYQMIKDFFLKTREEEHYENRSRRLDLADLEAGWNWANEEYFQENRDLQFRPNQKDFDWQLFYKGQGRSLPLRIRTASNQKTIARLSNFYNVDEVAMRKHVINCLDFNKTAIDFNALEEKLMSALVKKGVAAEYTDRYQASPITFLGHLSGKKEHVLRYEKNLLRDIRREYGFSNEVINTLVEYCLEQCQGQFVENYIRKVAHNWNRIGIKSRQEALGQIEKQNKRTKPARQQQEEALPDWYTYVPTETATPEMVAEARQLLEEMKKNAPNKRRS